MKPVLIYCFSLFLFINSVAQDPDFKFYNVEDGLPSNEIYDIFEDSKGYVWFATDNGVSKYDGQVFNNLSKKDGLPDNVIFFFHEDLKQRIWFVSYSGLLSYYHDDQIYSYTYNDTLNKYLNNITLINNASFYVDSLDNIFFGTVSQGIFEISNQGYLKIHNSNCRVQIQNNDDYSIVASNAKYTDRRARINDMHTIKSLKINNGRGRLKVYSLEHERLLFGNGDELFEIYGDSVLKREISVRGPFTNYSLDRDSNMWISYYGQGIEIFKKNTDEIRYRLFKNITVNAYLKDSQLGSWFGTNSGVYYSSNLDLNIINIGDLKNKKVESLTADFEGQIFFSSHNSSIYSFYKNKLSHIKASHKGIILSLSYDSINKQVLASSLYGHEYINNKGERTKPLIYLSPGLKKISLNYHFNKMVIPFNDSLLWRLHDGITYFNRNNSVITRIDNKKILKKVKLLTLFYSDSVLYIGSKEGLWTYDFDQIKPVFQENELLKSKIVDIAKDEFGNIWLAAKGNGVLCLRNDTVIQFSMKNGLPSDEVTTIFIDGNTTWAGTVNGLSKIIVNDIDSLKFTIENIYRHQGLASNVINDILKVEDVLYVATDKGVSYFNVTEYSSNNKEIPLYFTKVVVSGKDTIVSDYYNLSFDQNNIQITFQALNFKTGFKPLYKYRLIGTEHIWHETSQNSIRYPTLVPGDYTFELSAMNENGVWNASPITISINIDKPYWQSWWFYGLLFFVPLIIIALILFIIYNIKIKESDKRLVLYENLSRLRQEALAQQMNPHFIFNTLSSIQYYINENDKKASNKYLTMFARLMRLTLNNSYQKSIPISEELEALEIYIKLEQLRFSNKFTYKINIPTNIDPQKYLIPSLLLQPFVENSIWHGIMHMSDKGGEIQINLEKTKGELLFTVIDNGIGRGKSAEINSKVNKTHKSLGAKITESRLRLINSSKANKLVVSYSDLINEKGMSGGTRVRIRLPLIENKDANYS